MAHALYHFLVSLSKPHIGDLACNVHIYTSSTVLYKDIAYNRIPFEGFGHPACHIKAIPSFSDNKTYSNPPQYNGHISD